MNLIHPAYAAINNPLLKNSTEPVANPEAYFSNVIGTVISIFFIVAILYFTWNVVFSGYHMINSQGDSKKVEEARSHLTNAFVGIFIVFSIYAILALVVKVLGLDINITTWKIGLPSL